MDIHQSRAKNSLYALFGQEDDSISEMMAIQAYRPEFGFPIIHVKARHGSICLQPQTLGGNDRQIPEPSLSRQPAGIREQQSQKIR